jgi:mono/diheme cytochrome c family protein
MMTGINLRLPGGRPLWLVVLALAGLLAVACRSPEPILRQPDVQAGWGAAVYQIECARCHDPQRVVPLTVERLVPYRNAENLYAYISETMPLDKPGALPDYDYWAVTAYLMHASAVELPADAVLGPDTAAQVGFTP